MERNASYKAKFAHLKEWMPSIIESVKKDLKNEHLKRDPLFLKRYLGGKNPHKVEGADLAVAYDAALQEENGEELAEFIANRWIFRHGEIYHHFEEILRKIAADFTAIEELKPEDAQTLIASSISEYGALKTYLFSVLNSVAFSKKDFETLKQKAKEERVQKEVEEEKHQEIKSLEALKSAHALELARLTDRYEKKIIGMQKKYAQDVEALKKQVGMLQKKLTGVSV